VRVIGRQPLYDDGSGVNSGFMKDPQALTYTPVIYDALHPEPVLFCRLFGLRPHWARAGTPIPDWACPEPAFFSLRLRVPADAY